MTEQKFDFSREKKLRTKADFQTVFKRAKNSRTSYFTVLAYPNQRAYARLGVIVAKRVVRRAVDRSSIRRFVRECFRNQQQALVGFDMVVLIRSIPPSTGQFSYRDCLSKQWKEVIEKWQRA